MHGIVILYCLYNIQRGNLFRFQLFPIHEYLLIILWLFWFLVPRSCARINMVSEHTAGRRSISQKQDFWQISPWKVSNSSKFQHCTRSQGLPLNIPSKELVDQACLIDYAGCDESLECVGCPTLRYTFLFWFVGINRYNFEWTHQSLFSPHSQGIRNGIWRWLHLWRDEVSIGLGK